MSAKFLCAAMALGALSLQSCNLDNGETTQTFNVSVCNLIVPDDPDAEIKVQRNCGYSFLFNLKSNEATVSTQELELNAGKINFATNAMPFKWLTNGYYETRIFENGSATVNSGGMGEEVTNLHGYTTTGTVYYSSQVDPFPVEIPSPLPVMQYKIGNYTVKTFAQNTYFAGTTTTSYQMGPAAEVTEFKNDKPIYRVCFANDMKTANVVIYQVKFAESMSVSLEQVVLKNLAVTLTPSGYVIEGENVVPEMLDGSAFVPYPQRVFDSIKVETLGSDMTKILCTYTCAGVFHGSFTGYSTAQSMAADTAQN